MQGLLSSLIMLHITLSKFGSLWLLLSINQISGTTPISSMPCLLCYQKQRKNMIDFLHVIIVNTSQSWRHLKFQTQMEVFKLLHLLAMSRTKELFYNWGRTM